MKIFYENKHIERLLVIVNAMATLAVVAAALAQMGFHEPMLKINAFYIVLITAAAVFVTTKCIRYFNVLSKADFLRVNWFELPLLIALLVALLLADKWAGNYNPTGIRMAAIGIYLLLQILAKVCRTVVEMAASGRNPAITLICCFLVLIICGAGLLALPKSYTSEPVTIVDALFTATSATCVTGLIVKDTGADFTVIGQTIILILIQLGGLGIVIFGAVFALLLGQALSVSQSVAMQDLLNAQTSGRISRMIAFIFVGTITIEAIGAMSLFPIWPGSAAFEPHTAHQWFYSIFHSISAFCNAGFSLFDTSFIEYNKSWAIYTVVCPLIILGGLGFPVLYNLFSVCSDKVKRLFQKLIWPERAFVMQPPRRVQLQTKIVIIVSALLIVAGMFALMLFGLSLTDALFQSITARTAGFNTVDINAVSTPGKLVLILLMFIGGSPGSTAGGIKTVTLAVIVMAAVTTIRKRAEVEIFSRSIRLATIGKALTVVLLFVVVFIGVTLALSVTEKQNGFNMSQIMFEAGSALGTVGLTTGITGSLTTAGKLIIIVTMLIGRLGPLTLLAMLTFNLKQTRYSYPSEAVVVG